MRANKETICLLLTKENPPKRVSNNNLSY